ncbi:MAG: hypothetical protein U1F67_09015 [Rubrivivax sp.]
MQRHGEHARADAQAAPLGFFGRHLEAHAVVADDEVDDDAVLERAFRFGHQQHAGHRGELAQLRRAAAADEEDVQVVGVIALLHLLHDDRPAAHRTAGGDLLQLGAHVVGPEDADDQRRCR